MCVCVCVVGLYSVRINEQDGSAAAAKKNHSHMVES